MEPPQISASSSSALVPTSQITLWSRVRVALGTIVVAGLIPLIVNGYISFNAYRRSLVAEEASRITRTRNFLILIRDELVRAKEGLDRGELDVKLVDGALITPRAEWPTQVWYTARWNVNMLDLDSSLLQRLASVYDDIEHAKNIAQDAKQATGASNFMSPFLDEMNEAMRASGERFRNGRRRCRLRCSQRFKPTIRQKTGWVGGCPT